jgi:3-deoxy-D-manno-octulosonate 8-phosphate phosphatase (KDO 8-P phosphatase)
MTLADARSRAARIRVLALDVDGTLTDGRIYIGPQGEAMKAFNVRDGFGLTLLREAGLQLAIITARQSEIVRHRAAELGIAVVMQGERDKLAALQTLCRNLSITPDQVGYAGDDWTDLPAMLAAGFAATVVDAPEAVRSRAHWVSTLAAGSGAIRELAEFILDSRGELHSALARRLISAAAPERNDPQRGGR